MQKDLNEPDPTIHTSATDALTSSSRFELLVHAIKDYAIYLLDVEGHIISWNTGAEHFKGYTAEEIIGQHFSRFYTEEDCRIGIPERALATATEQGVYESEGWRVRKDGSRFWASIVIDPIFSETEELIGFAKITRDITERKRAQEEIDKQRARLSHAKKLEAIGRITGGVAHDFNNLLSVIRSAAELLGMANLSADKRTQYIEIIGNTAERAALLTRQLLAFAREQPLSPEAFDIASRIHGLRHVIEMTVGVGIQVNIQLPTDLPAVHADAAQFDTAVLNLVINARDAMPEGGTIRIGVSDATCSPLPREDDEPAAPPGEFIGITISDTGCGIEPSLIEKIFEPFFTTKALNEGTGLGLSQVYGFAKQSGGDVTVESQIAAGTTFSLYLPCATEHSPNPSLPATISARRSS
ncbi:PAS domain S-box protein [Alcaligenaceae bacterium CGII-47]|nr:PAS domain S-box protein [Alcaligenaceae bacterium CGII-47]